jgi:hypothetical protein
MSARGCHHECVLVGASPLRADRQMRRPTPGEPLGGSEASWRTNRLRTFST